VGGYILNFAFICSAKHGTAYKARLFFRGSDIVSYFLCRLDTTFMAAIGWVIFRQIKLYRVKNKKKVHQVAIFIVETLLASQAVLAHTITSCYDYQNHQSQTGFEPRSINEKLIIFLHS
jgi:hypothetical protein